MSLFRSESPFAQEHSRHERYERALQERSPQEIIKMAQENLDKDQEEHKRRLAMAQGLDDLDSIIEDISHEGRRIVTYDEWMTIQASLEEVRHTLTRGLG